MTSIEFELLLHDVLAKHFRFAVLPNVRLFRPSHSGTRQYGFEMDNLLHIAFEGSDYIIVVEAKNQPITFLNNEWRVSYDGTVKCARRQLQQHVATLKEYVEPLAKNVDLRFIGIVVSSDEQTAPKTVVIDDSEHYYCRQVNELPKLLSERFNLQKKPDRGLPEVMRLSQSGFLEMFRLGVPLEFLGHPEINSAIRYVERCRRSIDETIFQHFSPTPENWAINGSAGMGKSVLLGYGSCVLACGYELAYVNGKPRLQSAATRLAGMKFDATNGGLGVFAMTQRQLENLRGWFEHFAAIFRELDANDEVRFRRPEFHLCRTMTELEHRPWSAVLLDEAHDIEENVAKRLTYRHKKDGFYLMLACDRHQKLRLAGEDARILEGIDFSSHTKRLRQVYRNPSPVYMASLALMFRWFASDGPKIIPAKRELEEGFGFQVDGSPNEGIGIQLINDAHPANAWCHTVGEFPSAAIAFNAIEKAKLRRDEVLWVRFSGEDRDFDYECLHRYTYHNCRTEEAENLTDKYIKGQDFPVVVIEGFPSFMDRYVDPLESETSALHEKKMWKFRRELYLCASRATCFLYFICTSSSTPESESIKKEIKLLAKTLGTPENFDSTTSKVWGLRIEKIPDIYRRKLTVFNDSPVVEVGDEDKEENSSAPAGTTFPALPATVRAPAVAAPETEPRMSLDERKRRALELFEDDERPRVRRPAEAKKETVSTRASTTSPAFPATVQALPAESAERKPQLRVREQILQLIEEKKPRVRRPAEALPAPPVEAVVSSRPIFVLDGIITVTELAKRLEKKPFKIISELIAFKCFASADKPVAEEFQRKLAIKFGYDVREPTEEEKLEKQLVELRELFHPSTRQLGG